MAVKGVLGLWETINKLKEKNARLKESLQEIIKEIQAEDSDNYCKVLNIEAIVEKALINKGGK